jgi:branched-chain amino acid transport system substrate-binding protein
LKKSGQAHNKSAFVSTLSKLRVNTIVGPLNWQAGPVPNVTKTPLVGGQWRTGNTQSGYALVVVTNNGHTNIPVASSPQVIPGATV